MTGIHNVYFHVQFCVFVHTRLILRDSTEDMTSVSLLAATTLQKIDTAHWKHLLHEKKMTRVVHGAHSGELRFHGRHQ